MPTCKSCGSDKVYTALMHGATDELYRCTACGFTSGLPTANHDKDESLSTRIAKKSGAKLLLLIDQSNNSGIKQHVKGQLASANVGICAMMTAYWIGYHFKYDDHDEKFKDLITIGLKELVVAQVVYNKETDSRQKLLEERNKAKQDYEKLKDAYEVKANSKYIDLDLQTNKQQSCQKAEVLDKTVRAAYRAEINRMSLNLAKGDEVVNEEPLANLVSTVASSGPGFFAVSLHKPLGWLASFFFSDIGHVFGLHVTDAGCRLMDANTGLWECSSLEVLKSLLKAHMQEIYDGLFKGGNFTLWRFLSASKVSSSAATTTSSKQSSSAMASSSTALSSSAATTTSSSTKQSSSAAASTSSSAAP